MWRTEQTSIQVRTVGDRLRRGLCVQVGTRVGAQCGGVTLSLLKETLGEATYSWWPKVSLHQCYRATQIKPNPFQWAFHTERLQQKSSGVCLRKLFQGLHRFLHIYAQTWCQSTTHASLLPKMKSALGKKAQHNFSQHTAISKTRQSGHTWATQQCRQLRAVGCCPLLLPAPGPSLAKSTRAWVVRRVSSCDPAKNPREKLPGMDRRTPSSLQQWAWELAGRKKWAAALFWISSWKQRGHLGSFSAWASYPNSASKQGKCEACLKSDKWCRSYPQKGTQRADIHRVTHLHALKAVCPPSGARKDFSWCSIVYTVKMRRAFTFLLKASRSDHC